LKCPRIKEFEAFGIVSYKYEEEPNIMNIKNQIDISIVNTLSEIKKILRRNGMIQLIDCQFDSCDKMAVSWRNF